jgi:hypothetical protein
MYSKARLRTDLAKIKSDLRTIYSESEGPVKQLKISEI